MPSCEKLPGVKGIFNCLPMLNGLSIDKPLNGAISLGLILYSLPILYQFSLAATVCTRYNLPASPCIISCCDCANAVVTTDKTASNTITNFFMGIIFILFQAKMQKYLANKNPKKCILQYEEYHWKMENYRSGAWGQE